MVSIELGGGGAAAAATVGGSGGSKKWLTLGLLLLVLAAGGGGAYWWFVLRNKPGASPATSPGGDVPPPRGTLKRYDGYKGDIRPLTTCYSVSQLCSTPKGNGICLPSDSSPAAPLKCEPITPSGPGWAASSEDCQKQCDALNQVTGSTDSCYYANYNKMNQTCLLRPLLKDRHYEWCLPTQEPGEWENWSPEGSSNPCPKDQDLPEAVSDYVMGRKDLAAIIVPNAETCKVEVARRNLGNSQYYAVFNYVDEGTCYIKSSDLDVDPWGDCHTKAKGQLLIRDKSDTFDPRKIEQTTFSCMETTEVPVRGDLTANPSLSARSVDIGELWDDFSDKGEVNSANKCSKRCGDVFYQPRYGMGFGGQPASQWFPHGSTPGGSTPECWCYDWPELEKTTVFCTDQSKDSHNPKLTNNPTIPPVNIRKDIGPSNIAPSSTSMTSCPEGAFLRGTCTVDNQGGISNVCSAGWHPFVSRLGKDSDLSKAQCNCVADPLSPLLPLWTAMDGVDGKGLSADNCASGHVVNWKAYSYNTGGSYCAPKNDGSSSFAGACMFDTDCWWPEHGHQFTCGQKQFDDKVPVKWCVWPGPGHETTDVRNESTANPPSNTPRSADLTSPTDNSRLLAYNYPEP